MTDDQMMGPVPAGRRKSLGANNFLIAAIMAASAAMISSPAITSRHMRILKCQGSQN
jgi:hypothetical protein